MRREGGQAEHGRGENADHACIVAQLVTVGGWQSAVGSWLSSELAVGGEATAVEFYCVVVAGGLDVAELL